MTRINKITLQGFKSFADRVSLPFPEGFNVICGPNGSGKSNLTESVLFALGVSSAKHIRAERLGNLIFHGTKKRSAANNCKVSLYIDNKDKKIPVDEEIKITRKITDKGLSIFKLNGRVVTRNKVLDILSNIKLSPYGYNIIMQGDITKIIEMSSIERREIIDQISGIAEFDEKKRKTLIELEKVNKHTSEMEIITTEKQKLLEKLKDEKENAEKSVKLNDEAKRIRGSLINLEMKSIHEKLSEMDKKISENEKKFEELNKLFNEKEKLIDEKNSEIKKISNTIIEKSRDFEIIRKIDRINTEIIRRSDRIEMSKRELSRLKSLPDYLKTILDRNGVYGTVSQLIEIPVEYSTAIEIGVGKHMNDVVVENEEVAIECVKFLKEKKIGRARFLPLNRIKTKYIILKNKDNVIDLAINLIKFDKKYSNAINYVSNFIVVKDLENGKNIKEQIRIVTLDGDIIEQYGAITGGYYKDVKKSQRINLTKEINSLEKEIEKLEHELGQIKEAEKKGDEDIKEMERKKTINEDEVERDRKEIEKMYDERLELQSTISKLRVNKAKKEADIDNLNVEMENYKTDKFYDYKPEKLREMLKLTLIEIEKIGPVNMKASEEYKLISVEFDELKKRLDRLVSERDAIINTINEIEKRRYEKFMETLGIISSNFSGCYKDLMDGEAKLRLEEDCNLNSGLMIEATTESKKILDIDAMSGGEKTLTALAFLFAIQQFHSAPFYILDEIDAALDKVNTKKIVNFIKKYSNITQFIVVSHSDITIKEADSVFGVSMEEGASKVFSIKMPEK